MHYLTQQDDIVRQPLHLQQASPILHSCLSSVCGPFIVAFSKREYTTATGHWPSGSTIRNVAFQKHPRLCVDDAVRVEFTRRRYILQLARLMSTCAPSPSPMATRGFGRYITIIRDNCSTATTESSIFSGAQCPTGADPSQSSPPYVLLPGLSERRDFDTLHSSLSFSYCYTWAHTIRHCSHVSRISNRQCKSVCPVCFCRSFVAGGQLRAASTLP